MHRAAVADEAVVIADRKARRQGGHRDRRQHRRCPNHRRRRRRRLVAGQQIGAEAEQTQRANQRQKPTAHMRLIMQHVHRHWRNLFGARGNAWRHGLNDAGGGRRRVEEAEHFTRQRGWHLAARGEHADQLRHGVAERSGGGRAGDAEAAGDATQRIAAKRGFDLLARERFGIAVAEPGCGRIAEAGAAELLDQAAEAARRAGDQMQRFTHERCGDAAEAEAASDVADKGVEECHCIPPAQSCLLMTVAAQFVDGKKIGRAPPEGGATRLVRLSEPDGHSRPCGRIRPAGGAASRGWSRYDRCRPSSARSLR